MHRQRPWKLDLRCPLCDARFSVLTAGNDVWETLKVTRCPQCKGLEGKKSLPFGNSDPLIVKLKRERS